MIASAKPLREYFTPADASPAQQAETTRLLRLLLAQDGSTTRLCETQAQGPVGLHVLSQKVIEDAPPIVRAMLPGQRHLERITSLIAHGQVMMDNLCYVSLETVPVDIRSDLEAGVMPVGHLLQRLWLRRAALPPEGWSWDWVQQRLWSLTGLADVNASRAYQITTPNGPLMVIAETYRRGMWQQ
jgi:chorismate-pyruvate lyase